MTLWNKSLNLVAISSDNDNEFCTDAKLKGNNFCMSCQRLSQEALLCYCIDAKDVLA